MLFFPFPEKDMEGLILYRNSSDYIHTEQYLNRLQWEEINVHLLKTHFSEESVFATPSLTFESKRDASWLLAHVSWSLTVNHI